MVIKLATRDQAQLVVFAYQSGLAPGNGTPVTVDDECGIVSSRHEPPGSCGSHSLMTTVEARACPAIIPGPGRPGPLAHTDPLRPADPPRLLAYLATIHDPRRTSGRRHTLAAILASPPPRC